MSVVVQRTRFAARNMVGIPRLRQHKAPHRRPILSILADVFSVLIGLTAMFSVHLVGDLPVAEAFVASVFVPALILYRRRVLRPDAIRIYVLMAGWLLNQILTDLYRGTARIDWIRGDAAIVFFAIDLMIAVMLMSGNDRRKLLFIGGFAIGSLLAFRFQPTELAEQAPWKFGLSGGVNLLVVLASTFFYNRRRYLTALFLLLGIAAVNLVQDYRSPVLLLLLTIGLTIPVIPEQIGPWRVLPPAGSRARVVVLMSIALLMTVSAIGLVKVLSSRGYLGEEAQAKNEEQAQFKGGLLIGGRPEILVSSRAVLSSPILGHGSWAKDYKYVNMLTDISVESGAERDADYEEEISGGLIPTHSHLMGAWVWAGILGAVFWGYIFWITGRAGLLVAVHHVPYSSLFMFLFIGQLWDTLFSPFGTSRRIFESIVIVIVLDLLREKGINFRPMQLLRRPTWRRHALRGYAPGISPSAHSNSNS
ncbi:MAG TPA: hypothetical protein VG893_13200 [Terracidiphilus sp.]|nr:hypothetical protein [Terracidiphilus sp.]